MTPKCNDGRKNKDDSQEEKKLAQNKHFVVASSPRRNEYCFFFLSKVVLGWLLYFLLRRMLVIFCSLFITGGSVVSLFRAGTWPFHGLALFSVLTSFITMIFYSLIFYGFGCMCVWLCEWASVCACAVVYVSEWCGALCVRLSVFIVID